VWVLVIIGYLFKIQVFSYSKYRSRVSAQTKRTFKLHPKRGTIYDGSGEVLAISVKTKSAALSAKDEVKAMSTFRKVVKKIKLSSGKRKEIIERIKRGNRFIWLKRKLSDREYLKLKSLNKQSRHDTPIFFVDEYRRIYPQEERAAHILGGVGIDEQGLAGLEYEMDSQIKGHGGLVNGMVDARQKVFNLEYIEFPETGKDVYLTIDSTLQYFVEQELRKSVRSYNAKGGAVIVMDTMSGAILAMASYPFYRPDRISKTSSQLLRNKCTSFLYDPGSTFKIVLAASAFENNIVKPHQSINCRNGSMTISDSTITDSHAFQTLSFEEVIVKSSNVGAATVGLRLGKKRYYKSILQFGFGSKTGVRLPAEENGILNPVSKWNDVSVAFLSHGYEISVTPMQMVRAFNVIATGGFLVRPFIIKKVDGVAVRPFKRERVLQDSTCKKLKGIMSQVVKRGTGKKTSIDGISIAGKTGTAQKLKNGKYIEKHIASFGGFFPAGNPRITMFVMIDEPRPLFYGGDVAAPLFKSITKKLLVYLNLFPQSAGVKEISI
jgi:cell division protein FtsI (penicillin-binding protein 3)